MARKESVQTGGIILSAGWKLWPLDERNWELCKMADDGSWKPFGRYYSYNTIEEALLYVADNLLKAKCHGRHMELQDALREYRSIADSLRQAVAA